MYRYSHFLVVAAGVVATLFLPSLVHAESPKDSLMGCFQKSTSTEEYDAIGDQIIANLSGDNDNAAGPIGVAAARENAANNAMARLTTQACKVEVQNLVSVNGQDGLKFVLAELASLSLTVRMGTLYAASEDAKKDPSQ